MRTFLSASALLILSIAFSSCINRSNDATIRYTILEESFDRSRLALEEANFHVYAALDQKLDDLTTHEKALIWLPKVTFIKQNCNDMKSHITALRDTIKRISKNPTAINELFQKSGKELFKCLENLKSELLNVDSGLRREFNTKIRLVTSYQDIEKNGVKDLANIYFQNTSIPVTVAMLSGLLSHITEMENRMINYCNSQCEVINENWKSYSAIIAQNTRYLKPGDELEINAGVGGFSKTCKPRIKINRTDIDVAYDGVATYKMRVSGKRGKFNIPVIVAFTDEEGKQQEIASKIEYTVIK
jgi:hypothetical protein